MRKFLIISTLALISSVLSAQPFFCDKAGTELYYVRTFADDGDVKWTNTLSIKSIDSAPDGSQTIHYSMMRSSADGDEQMKRPAELSVHITPGGDTVMSVGETMALSIKGFFPKMKVTATGEDSILPNDMKPGDILADASAVAKAMGISYSVKVIERKVIGEDTITTPAGTFDCVIVSEHKLEKAPGYSRDTVAKTWYARGIGMVRHDTYKKGVISTSEILMSIK